MQLGDQMVIINSTKSITRKKDSRRIPKSELYRLSVYLYCMNIVIEYCRYLEMERVVFFG